MRLNSKKEKKVNMEHYLAELEKVLPGGHIKEPEGGLTSKKWYDRGKPWVWRKEKEDEIVGHKVELFYDTGYGMLALFIDDACAGVELECVRGLDGQVIGLDDDTDIGACLYVKVI